MTSTDRFKSIADEIEVVYKNPKCRHLDLPKQGIEGQIIRPADEEDCEGEVEGHKNAIR